MQIVTLTTDFGTIDHYVASLKGIILKHVEQCNFVDITHEINSFDIIGCAYLLGNCYHNFPKSTIHCISVNTYYTGEPEVLVFEKNGHFFIGPNNGVFSLIFEDIATTKVHRIDLDEKTSNGMAMKYAHAIACISNNLSLEDIGPQIDEIKQKLNLKAVFSSESIRATVIHVDKYGNVIFNVTRDLFEKARKGRNFKLYFKRNDPITSIAESYGSVQIGDVVSIFNDNALLEIAINLGSASTLLGLNVGETIQIDFH